MTPYSMYVGGLSGFYVCVWNYPYLCVWEVTIILLLHIPSKQRVVVHHDFVNVQKSPLQTYI